MNNTVIKLIPQTPTLAAIFNDDAIRHELTLFSQAELDAVESGLFYKKDKPYLVCAASDKERPAKPEEIVRQLWLRRLIEKYGYPKHRIGVEHGVHFGREVKRADAVIFDADKPDAVYIIGEFKKTKLKDGKDQLKSYSHATGAPIGFWSNGAAVFIYHRKDPNHFIELPDIPSALETIEQILAQPWTLDTLIEKEKARAGARASRPSSRKWKTRYWRMRAWMCSRRRSSSSIPSCMTSCRFSTASTSICGSATPIPKAM